MGTYVIGDIHGCYDEFIQLKNKIEKEDSDAELILIGDIVDRGPQVLEMVRWAMNNIDNTSGRYKMILGNHEDEKIDWIQRLRKFKERNNISDEEILGEFHSDNYNFWETLLDNDVNYKEILDMHRFFIDLPLFFKRKINGRKFIIAHANFPYSMYDENSKMIKEGISVSQRDFILWDRDTYDFEAVPKTILVAGHTPTISDSYFYNEVTPGKIYKAYNRYIIDCGCVFRQFGWDNANLAALRLNDLKEIYLYD